MRDDRSLSAANAYDCKPSSTHAHEEAFVYFHHAPCACMCMAVNDGRRIIDANLQIWQKGKVSLCLYLSSLLYEYVLMYSGLVLVDCSCFHSLIFSITTSTVRIHTH